MSAYQRQRELARISPYAREIQERILELDKEKERTATPQESIMQMQSERTLDRVNEQSLREILKNMRPEQAQKIVRQRELERVREHVRGR